MFLNPFRQKHSVWEASCKRLDPATARGIEIATARAAAAMRGGRLLSSLEARLLAGAEARSCDTLYSIARSTARDYAADEDEILLALERRFKGLK
jgi:hypothetical protein